MTGVPVIGVVPWLHHHLPDEDGASTPAAGGEQIPIVAVIRYPFASNLDEFKLLEQVAFVRWARIPADLDGAGLIVLPGSKQVANDLAWLRSMGLDRALHTRVRQGVRVVGVCGGLQMLGHRLRDPAGVDGSGDGLGLLHVETMFQRDKLARRTAAKFARGLQGPWSPVSGLGYDGYEIRHGRTEPDGPVQVAIPDVGWIDGAVLGVTVHGMFENAAILRALFGNEPRFSLDSALDELADMVMANIDEAFIEDLVRSPARHDLHVT
jgi:adenosylcobyric acid synthase